MQINITEKTAEVLVRLHDRYYFDLFKNIRTDINEEYVFRNAISEVADEIKKQWQTPDINKKWIDLTYNLTMCIIHTRYKEIYECKRDNKNP